MTAAKAAERDAKQRNKQKKKNSETVKQRNEQKKKNSETTVSLLSNFLSLFASFFVIMTFKSQDRLKDSKNLTLITTTITTTFNESSFSFVSFMMTTIIKSDRAVKKTTVWEQKSQSRRHSWESTLKIVTLKSMRKRSKSNLMTTATLNERKSQQKRLIESAFVIE